MTRDYAWADARRAEIKAELKALDETFPISGRPRLIDAFMEIVQKAGRGGISYADMADKHGINREAVKRFLYRNGLNDVAVFVFLRGSNGGMLFAHQDWCDAAAKAEKTVVAERRSRHLWHCIEAVQEKEARLAAEKTQREAKEKTSAMPSQPVYSRHQLAALPAGHQSPLNPQDCRPWAVAACGGTR